MKIIFINKNVKPYNLVIMKIYWLIIFAILSVTLSCSTTKVTAFSAEERAMINIREYTLYVSAAHPQGWRSITLNGLDYLKVDGDKVTSHLPYFGRAYNLPYAGGDGLSFVSTIEDYKMEEGKKGKLEIQFKTTNSGERFEYYIVIYPVGSATIDVRSTNRQHIRFSATLDVNE